MQNISEYILEKLKLSKDTKPEFEDEFVDLDLPSGTLWATMNVDAKQSDNYKDWCGGYYAWGETKPNKEKWVWDKYKFCKSPGNISKYCKKDKKSVLDLSDDAANKKNNEMRIPQIEQVKELIENTEFRWIGKGYQDVDNLCGVKFISKKNGKSVFIPAGGYMMVNDIHNDHFMVYIMSSTKSTDNVSKYYAAIASISQSPEIVEIDRYRGINIRPVKI